MPFTSARSGPVSRQSVSSLRTAAVSTPLPIRTSWVRRSSSGCHGDG